MTQYQIVGTISSPSTLTGTLFVNETLIGVLTVPSSISGTPYEGDYEVTPRMYVQSLETMGKYMTNDVTVHEIPVTKTSNPQGGQTVLIG